MLRNIVFTTIAAALVVELLLFAAFVAQHKQLMAEHEAFTGLPAASDRWVEEIREAHAAGRPVLVGTLSVAESEDLARAVGEAT